MLIFQLLTWDSEAEVIEKYCQKNIITPIMNTEFEEKSMLKWLTTLHCYTYDIMKESEKDNRDRLVSRTVN